MSTPRLQSADNRLSDLEKAPKEHAANTHNSTVTIEATDKPADSEFTTRACLCLLGAFFAMFCSIGFINAFGVFQEYYSQELLSDKSASAISWLGSFNLFFMLAGTLLTGYLLEKKGPQALLATGTLIVPVALIMTSLCKHYYQFFLAQGVLLGFGISFVILPAVASVPRYFTHSRGYALGITIAGSSLGGIIWPMALRNLFVKVGFAWGVRIAALIMLPLLVTASLTVREPVSVGAGARPKPDFKAVRNPVLMLLAGGQFMTFFGLFTPFFYITSWTLEQGLDADMAFYMVSIINAASTFGRIIPGILADRYGPFNAMIVAVGTSGVVCCCWTKATGMVGIVCLSLAYGFCSGGAISLQSACGAAITKPENYGIVIGSMMAFVSIAGLVGTPINGQLLDAYGYLRISLFSGTVELLGMVFIILARLKLNGKLLAKV